MKSYPPDRDNRSILQINGPDDGAQWRNWMDLALDQAEKAGQLGEVPIGAVLVAANGRILARAHNACIQRNDPTAHAEMLVLRKAANTIGNYRLNGTTLVATIEPCIMCMGAIVHARLERVVFGAADPKWGAAGSLFDLASDRRLNHQVQIISGIREKPCRQLIQSFFQARRGKNRS